ncbi:MAG: hypothetical protein BYD32DRAFT_429871 [Podila humilis]|nr:MAG: hypothetical protein BYD32DRAFT_429871 [Podila humilis]
MMLRVVSKSIERWWRMYFGGVYGYIATTCVILIIDNLREGSLSYDRHSVTPIQILMGLWLVMTHRLMVKWRNEDSISRPRPHFLCLLNTAQPATQCQKHDSQGYAHCGRRLLTGVKKILDARKLARTPPLPSRPSLFNGMCFKSMEG